MLEDIKLLLNLTDDSKDDLLNLLIEQAVEYAQNYTRRDDIVDISEATIKQMVVYLFNRQGTEGLKSESYSGVSYNYENAYPESILASLRARRLAKFY